MKELIDKDSFEYSDGKNPNEEEVNEDSAEDQEGKEADESDEEEKEGEEEKESGEESQEKQDEESEEKVDYVKLINEKYGKSFASEEDIKKFFDLEKEVGTLRKQIEDNDQWKEKYTKLQENYQADKIFANEGIRKMNEVIKKFPSVNADVALRILDADVNKMTTLDIVILGKQLNVRGFKGGDSAAKRQIAKQLDIDESDLIDASSLPDEVLNQLSEEAMKYRQQFAEMQTIELPDYSDLDTEAKKFGEEKKAEEKQLNESWTSALDDILDSFTEYIMYDKNDKGEDIELYKHVVDDEFKAKHKDFILENIVKSGLKPDKEGLERAKNYIETYYGGLYRVSILKGFGKAVETKMKDKEHEDYNVPPGKKEESEGAKETTLPGNEQLENYLAGQPKVDKLGKRIFGFSV